MSKKPRDSSCSSMDGSEISFKVPRVGSSPPPRVSKPLAAAVDGKVKKVGKGVKGKDRLPGAAEDLGGQVKAVEATAASGRMRGRGGESIRALRLITSELMDLAMEEAVTQAGLKSFLGLAGRYEDLVLAVLLENELLRGKLEALEAYGVSRGAPVASGVVAAPSAPEMPTPIRTELAPKPVETWSVVVKSGDTKATPEEVVDKVVEEVVPALGVRVHTLKPIKRGGAVIRTPSVSERDRILNSTKFKELGLEVSVNKARADRIIVREVDSAISPALFMEELYLKNLKGVMTEDDFRKEVHLVGGPWKADEGSVNVVLEGNSVAINTILGNDRCYIGWFAFRVRQFNSREGCFKCCGFGHFASECRVEGVVCFRCGGLGHRVRECRNALSCRNCAFKGLPSDHRMMSMQCPMYVAQVARVSARH